MKQLLAFEVTERFYEIGSPRAYGIREFARPVFLHGEPFFSGFDYSFILTFYYSKQKSIYFLFDKLF